MRSERGFALIAALWLLVALSVVGLEFGLRARARRLAAANVQEAGRAAAAADAGVADAQALLAHLADGSSDTRSPDPNRLLDPWAQCAALRADTTAIGDARYAVALRDASAALNLNRASEEELRRFFVALRVDFGAADRLAQAIMDWQDTDDFHRARGAEREEYLRAGAPVLPANRPFDHLADLRHVAGMTPDLYRALRPDLTLLGTGQINLNSAPRPVLLALPGMTEQAVAVALRRRTGSRPIRSLAELSNELPSGPRAALQADFAALSARLVFETREVIATADGWTDGSPVHGTVEALFARGGTNAFLVWRSAR
jgi:general secretion pathway protein K